MVHTFIDNLVDKWCRVVIFRESGVEVMVISANTDGALFFVNREGVGYPICVFDWVDEANSVKLVNLNFNSWRFGGE